MLRKMATPEAMTALVSKDLQKRQKALTSFLANDSLLLKIFDNNLSSNEVDALSKEPFYIYAFKGNYLLQFWNNNTVVGTCDKVMKSEKNSLYKYNGTYYKECLHPSVLKPNGHIVALLPIRFNYPIQNDYLRSSFVAADYIPVSTIATDVKKKDSHAVKDAAGRTLFYLNYRLQDLPKHIPDNWLNVFFIAAMLCSLLWFHLMAIALARRYAPIYGLAILLSAVTIILSVVYLFEIPFYFNELAIFSPSLYASSRVFPSLGVLLIVSSCCLWLLIFFVTYFRKPIIQSHNLFVRFFLIIIWLIVLTACAIAPVNIIHDLALNSRISFDVSDFYAINYFTIVGLFTILLILFCNTLIIFYCNLQLSYHLPNRLIKYAALLILLAVYHLGVGSVFDGCQYIYTISVFVFILLFDFFFAEKKIKIFSSESFSAGILMVIFATILLHHFNEEKSSINEKAFAEKIVRQRDNILEFVFKDIADSISHDALLKNYCSAPRQGDRSFMNEHITTRYLRGQLNRYQTNIYFYNQAGRPLYNTDTLKLSDIDTALKNGEPVIEPYLYFFDNAKDGRSYIAHIPLTDDAGIVVLTLQLKKDGNTSVYPELLQSTNLQEQNEGDNYTYGIYAYRQLITQNNDYPFPFYLRSDSMKEGTMRTYKREGYNIDVYKIEAGKRVAIINVQEQWMEMITLFSYLLGMLMLCVLTVFLFAFYIKYVFHDDSTSSIFQMTLRGRIHWAMLSVVMLSFVVIGVATIMVFTNRYENNNEIKLRNAMQTVERAVQDYLRNKKVKVDAASFHEETQSTQFKSFIADLANNERLDINVYNSYGTLNATSQEDIYNKALLARIMMPDAYYKMSEQHKSLLVEEEKIGRLQYLSSYLPVRNMNGNAVGYINVPFFSSQKELNYQISNILVALINLYALIFLVSGILAVGIANWLTKGLQVLIEKFKTFDLKENEKIAWGYDDEIGLLLREYNKMVEKVVGNAKRLAQSERESAWREMAKQVAHEIKNPLTPMKLNIQYLQHAMDKNHRNIEQITRNVSASLIEQIDTLSNIASAFSDFAKMPEAMPELIVLNVVLKNAVELYNKSNNIQIDYEATFELLVSYIDKSQLLRVFNNLLKNATEAIPDERTAAIRVRLQKTDHKALITIQDNGTGISDEVAAHIFSPYFTTKGSGTGLGLAMTKKIVEFWNGKIWFETELNTGTTFFIELPLK